MKFSSFPSTLLLLLLLLISVSYQAQGWVQPEHRNIAIKAILRLDSAHRLKLDRLWALSRKGSESRLSIPVADTLQNENPRFLDFTAWPAIAGDHSTSPGNMLFNVLHTDWILNVAAVAARLKSGLAGAKNRSERAWQLRSSDLRLLRADPGYVSRAGSNNVHFILARPAVNSPPDAYFDSCSRQGSPMNLIGTYTWFHTSAILKAQRIAAGNLNEDQFSLLACAALADEAFAIHFLEDGFASGHVAGIWGNAALRKGTHDYYDEYGLEVTTWQGARTVLTGDAYMRPADADRAAAAVTLSLEQLIDATDRKYTPPLFNDQPGVFVPDTFNIAHAVVMPFRQTDPAFRQLFDRVLMLTPVPGLATGLGQIPRFRSEVGPFIGIAPGLRIGGITGGFGENQKTSGIVPGLEIALHLGLGMDCILNESGDGLVFVDLGWRLDGASTIKLAYDPAYNYFGSILSAIPSREAFYTRIRMPFYLIPGDLLVLGPLLLILSPKDLTKVIARAGQGGLIPWQTGIGTPVGRFQYILGREIGTCFYGSAQGADAFLLPDATKGQGALSLISMNSTQLEFPFLEYRPMRTFSRRQSASMVVQLNAGVDIPGKVSLASPPDSGPVHAKSIWFVGVRLSFDWRYYYARKKS